MISKIKLNEIRNTFIDREIPNWPVEKEDKMISVMREEKFRDIIKKQQEEEERIRLQQEKEREAMKADTYKPKEVDGRKFTFDVNGSSIVMKDIEVDKLAIDFSFPRFDIKEKQAVSNNIAYKPQLQQDKNLQQSNNSLDKKTIEELEAVEKPNRRLLRKDSLINFKAERTPIQPAGSNYDLIAPETGVTLIEGNKSKSGSTDYHQKFGKYSKYDYNIMLKQLGNKSLPTISVNNNNNSQISKDNSTLIINKSTINPLVNYNDSLIDNTFNSVIDNNLMSVNSSDYSKKNRMNLNDSLKISSRFGNGLKASFDSLYIIPELSEKIAQVSNNFNNLSGLYISKKIKIHSGSKSTRNRNEPLDVINKFNLSIIKNPKWGAYDEDIAKVSERRKTHKKLKKNDVEVDVGKNIFKIKLPRSRNFNIEKNKIDHLK